MSKIKNIFTLTIGQGFNTLMNLLFLPYLARSMSYEDYGSYGQTLLVVDIAKTFLLFGLPQMIFVWLADKNKNKESVITNNLFAGFFAGILGLLFFYFSNSYFANLFDNKNLDTLILIYAVSIVFQLPVFNLNSVLIFKQKIKNNIKVIIFGNILKIFLVLISIQVYHSIYYVIWSLVISSLFQFCLAIFFNKESIKPKLIKFKQILKQINVGFPLGLTGVIGVALLTTDGFMVSKMLGVKEYAIYRNGAIEVPFISTIYGSIAAIILPEVSKLFSEGKYKEIINLKRKVITNTAMIIYPIMLYLVFFNKEIITLYLGSKYQDSGIIFAVFTLTLLIRINDYLDILLSAKKNNIILNVYIFVFISNVILNYIFISMFNSIGAAISTIISLFIFATILVYKSMETINDSVFNLIDFNKIIKLILIVLLIIIPFYCLKYFFGALPLIIISFSLFFPIIYFILIRNKLLELHILSAILPSKITKLLRI